MLLDLFFFQHQYTGFSYTVTFEYAHHYSPCAYYINILYWNQKN